MNQQAPDNLNPNEVLRWAEFCSWAALVMTPIIWSLHLLLSGCLPTSADSVELATESAVLPIEQQPLDESIRLREGGSSEKCDEARLTAVLTDVADVLREYQDEPIRLQASPWVRMHALVQYPIEAIGQSAQFAAQRESLISGVISSPIADVGVLTIRDNSVFPRADGHLFGRQHHPDQALAYLSLAGVELAEPLTVDGQRFTVRDLLNASMRDVWRSRELSWTVSAYAQYLEPSQQWTNRFGEQMSLEALVKSLLNANEPACGGSHRLAALALVVRHPKLRAGMQSSGVWNEVLSVLRRELATLKADQLQTGFFPLPSILASADHVSLVERDIQFTGHTLEWISLLPDSELTHSEWVIRAVEAVTAHLPELSDRYREAVAPSRPWPAVDASSQFVAGTVSHAVGGLTRWSMRARE